MSWFLRTFTGFVVALLILGVGGYFGLTYILTRLTASPPRPTFPNDDPNYGKTVANKQAPPPAAPKAAAKPAPKLPAGAYEAIVKQPIGLVVRGAPDLSANQIDGVEYNEPVIVLSKSQDGRWEKIRYGSNNTEGWVKAGNTKKAE